MSKAEYDIVDSSKKRTKCTQDTILSVFLLFFGRIQDFIICFQDLLTQELTVPTCTLCLLRIESVSQKPGKMWAFFMVRALMRKKDCMENELFSDFSLQASFFPCLPQRRKIVQIIYCVFFYFFILWEQEKCVCAENQKC